MILLMFLPMTTVDSTYVWPEVEEAKVEPKVREIKAIVTAYNESDDLTPGTTMANGQQVYYGAVANDQLPLGTKVEIDGETFEVCDRFGGSYGIERFDMYLPSRGECERWGRQKKIVRILEVN